MSLKRATILVVTGTRAEYGLFSSTFAELKKSKVLNYRVLVTGSHTLRRYGNTIQEIRKDKERIDAIVPVREFDTMVECLATEMIGIEKYLVKNKPELVLVLGDRDEPLAAALAAAHHGIPVVHVHGGDVTAGVVDDAIRAMLTKIASLHFAISPRSANNIFTLGEEKWRIHVVGAPGLDALRTMKFPNRTALAKQYGLDPKKPWYLVLQHPTPLDSLSADKQIKPILDVMQKIEGEKIAIFPNTDTGSRTIISALSKLKKKSDWHLFPNLPRQTYLSFLKYSAALVGNSSSGIIESTFFKIPVINIGNRQRGRECGANVLHVGYSATEIRTALAKIQTTQFQKICAKAATPYGKGEAGKKIVSLLEKFATDPRLYPKKYVRGT